MSMEPSHLDLHNGYVELVLPMRTTKGTLPVIINCSYIPLSICSMIVCYKEDNAGYHAQNGKLQSICIDNVNVVSSSS